MEEEGSQQMSRVEKSLQGGYWDYPLEPTSEEICAALRARNHLHYDDGYPENLVSLNRFFVMHKVGYRNGKGVKLEGWKTYDDHLMTKTSSGPLNGNENLVLRIFALRPVTKGIEPIKLCWVKELSKGHQSGRRKKFQPEGESGPNKKSKTNANTVAMNKMITVSSLSSPPLPSHSTIVQSDSPISPNGNLMALYNAIPHQPKQEPHSPLSPISPLSISKFVTPLPGLHETLAGLSGSLPPFQLPSTDTPSHTTTTVSTTSSSVDPSSSPPSSTAITTSSTTPQSPTSPSTFSSTLTPIPLKSESPSPPHHQGPSRNLWDVPTRSTLPPTSNTSFIIAPNSYSYSTTSSFSDIPPPMDTQAGEGTGKQRKSHASRDAPFPWKS